MELLKTMVEFDIEINVFFYYDSHELIELLDGYCLNVVYLYANSIRGILVTVDTGCQLGRI